MPDDVKLQLGIDVEALQRTASQATNVLTQAFEKGIGANLLGNGLPATQGPTPAPQKDTISTVVSALQQVNQTLIAGFNALAGGAYLGGGGGGGAGGGAGGGGPGGAGAAGGGLAPATPGQGVAGGRLGIAGQILSRAGDLASALMPSSMRMFMGGFYGTDVMGFAHNLLSQVPVAGKLLGAVTAPFHQVMQQNDEFKNMQYETFRDSGNDAMNSFTNLWTGDAYRDQFTKRYGFSRSETQQLVGAGARRGLGQGQGMEAVLNMQGTLGLGQEAAETMGGLRRAGLKPGQETEVLANAIGVAVSTGLERGRWGEMLSMWQRAAQSSVDTDVAWKEVAAQQQFVGSLGARFKGDTPAAQSMDQALRQAASNTQSPFTLRGAWQLSGGDYFGATARMARAAEQPDVELEGSIVDQMLGTPGVQAWLAMPDGMDADRALDRVAGVASMYGTGLSQLKIATLLKARKATRGALIKPASTAAATIGGTYATGTAALPATALGPRRRETEAQRPSGISAIQEVGAVAPSPQEQLDREQRMNAPTIPGRFPGRGGTSQAEVRSHGDFVSANESAPFAGGAGAPGSQSSYQPFVAQRFGNPISGGRTHPGVDLAFPPGTSLTSPVDGVVAFIDRTNSGESVGIGIHIRDAAGMIHKIYHIDPATFPTSLQVGARITRGTALGRTYSVRNWQGPGGQQVRAHLHYGQVNAGGTLLDPMRTGGIAPGALTGGVTPAPGGGTAAVGGSGGGGSGGGFGGGANITADVHVYVHNDASGRPVVRVRGATPVVTSSPGQLVGGTR